jgi:hypothetical protein
MTKQKKEKRWGMNGPGERVWRREGPILEGEQKQRAKSWGREEKKEEEV